MRRNRRAAIVDVRPSGFHDDGRNPAPSLSGIAGDRHDDIAVTGRLGDGQPDHKDRPPWPRTSRPYQPLIGRSLFPRHLSAATSTTAIRSPQALEHAEPRVLVTIN